VPPANRLSLILKQADRVWPEAAGEANSAIAVKLQINETFQAVHLHADGGIPLCIADIKIRSNIAS
jgi:hypothetical protein